jgi:hypothetical protein
MNEATGRLTRASTTVPLAANTRGNYFLKIAIVCRRQSNAY